jgi:hypothetical protein
MPHMLIYNGLVGLTHNGVKVDQLEGGSKLCILLYNYEGLYSCLHKYLLTYLLYIYMTIM